jgi:DNA-directed RNA polymerase specialized sigma24 family protein
MVVDDVLADLPESHRRMVDLRIDGHEIAEISREVGRSKRSVERVLQDFRIRMGELIHGFE